VTIREIADLCGVDASTIRKWINREDFLKGNFPLRNAILEKLEHGSPERPSDFDLEETLAIIESGGNATLAALLRENAANKSALTVAGSLNARRDTAFIEQLIGQLVEAKITAAMSRIPAPVPQRAPSRDTVRAHKEITQVLTAMRKWQDAYFIVSHAEFDRVINLLMSAKKCLVGD
jgi:DNA-binding MurR/RpiR family transcriptional regulator